MSSNEKYAATPGNLFSEVLSWNELSQKVSELEVKS